MLPMTYSRSLAALVMKNMRAMLRLAGRWHEMKKAKTIKPRQIWEPENNRTKLQLPKPVKVFSAPPPIREGELARRVNPGGALHSENNPAVEFQDGGLEWWRHGQLHRDGDLPAMRVEESNSLVLDRFSGIFHKPTHDVLLVPGTEIWCKDGFIHRDGMPALQMVFADGNFSEEYWCNGRLHNSSGPAIRMRHLDVWFYHGLAHREDGPAAISHRSADNQKFWTWYGNVLVEDGSVRPEFPFENPPAKYLLEALHDAKFSDTLIPSLMLMQPHVDSLMPDFKQHIGDCCDAVSWALFQAHIRKALNPGAIHESFDCSFALC